MPTLLSLVSNLEKRVAENENRVGCLISPRTRSDFADCRDQFSEPAFEVFTKRADFGQTKGATLVLGASFHSDRSACIGSMTAARRAGINPAIMAQAASRNTAPPRISGS
jgi:hypothetical protein